MVNAVSVLPLATLTSVSSYTSGAKTITGALTLVIVDLHVTACTGTGILQINRVGLGGDATIYPMKSMIIQPGARDYALAVSTYALSGLLSSASLIGR